VDAKVTSSAIFLPFLARDAKSVPQAGQIITSRVVVLLNGRLDAQKVPSITAACTLSRCERGATTLLVSSQIIVSVSIA
jgi:anti-anti-sigma regulatory factor